MQSTTSAFRQALTSSHRMAVQVDAYYDGELTYENLPIVDGAVTLDRGSKVRRSLALTIGDLSLLPWDSADPLAVYGQELVVKRGIPLAGGTEWVPLGTFRIDEPSADVRMGPLTLTGKSAEVAIQDAKFVVPTSSRGHGTCMDVITYLIREVDPDAVIVNNTVGARNPGCPIADWTANADRWDAVTQVARAMHAEIYCDASNRYVVSDVPNPLTSPVAWDIADGEGGTLISAARTLSRSAVYNAVVVIGENTSSGNAPVSAIAYDDDPTSPTRWGGPYGKVPLSYPSALLTSSADCQAVADSMLFDATAANVQVAINAIPNPALEAADCVRARYAGRLNLFIIQALTIPLTAHGAASITLRGGKEDPS
ncbi:DUF5047 domain-containing protein [Streptomyces sp. H27-H1]|uniref:DUF5047 domain-containing protein n=1 Tax=Streptomyces sp. H27-H1 TaxID=2996461 RepID=UPI002270E0B9|nr:DUF5047 domain-containing protein [Streptomyces sp. H27-H1]MCY0926221.1 DUF5047 domain-containing protein [Streptomyces sp. H27-H1]